jgi:hypothetical protein
MGGIAGRPQKGLPPLAPSTLAFGGRNMPQPAGLAKLLHSSRGQQTMPVPGAPRLPMNPFPEIARQGQRLGLF